MAKYKFSVNVDITSFKGGNVATTETVTLSNYGNDNKKRFINREYKVVRI